MVHEEDRTLRPGKRLLDAPDRGEDPGPRPNRGNEWVIHPHLGPEVCKLLDDLDDRGLSRVVDVLLVDRIFKAIFNSVDPPANINHSFLSSVTCL